MLLRVLTPTLSAWLCLGCASHVPEPLGLVPGTPHVSWIIMTGDRDNPDRDFACQSDPPNDCVVPASQPDARVFTDVHFYFHGAGSETKYSGAIQLGFLEGPGDHLIRPNVSVRRTEEIANSSVSGIVSSKPGTYTVKFDLVANVGQTGQTHPIQIEVPVVVK